MYYVINWEANDYNTDIAQYLTMKFGQLVECNMRSVFLKKSLTECGG